MDEHINTEEINKPGILKIAGFVDDSIVDGPGLRLCIFMQGCDKDCPGCHNQETRPMTGGKEYTPTEVFARVEANPLLTGVTFSGGEPLLQARALLPLAMLIKGKGLSLAIYTGDVLETIIKRNDEDQIRLLSMCDVIIDGPFVLSQKSLTLRFRGSSNQRILDAKASLREGHAVPVSDTAWGL